MGDYLGFRAVEGFVYGVGISVSGLRVEVLGLGLM